MFKYKDQIFRIVSYNYQKKAIVSSDFSTFLSKAKDFMNNRGLYMSDYKSIIINIKPQDDLNKKIKTIKNYIDSLVNSNNEDFLKYENYDLYCINKRSECSWIIQYINPILENRKQIYNAMYNCGYEWKYRFYESSEDIFNIGYKILLKKYFNHFDNEYTKYLNDFKKYNLQYSIKNGNSNKFYDYIIELVNLKTSY